MGKIRMAVLGAGPRWMSLVETYTAHPELEIVAICDRADGYAGNACAELKRIRGMEAVPYHDFEKMAKEARYDAIFIDCDPDIQVDFAVSEMDRGIHVMTEVPAAYTIEQCRSLVSAVRRNGVKYQLAEQTRYWHFISQWRDMSRAGEFGQIYYAEGEYLHYEKAWDYFRNKKTGHRVWTDDPSLDKDPDYERTWRYRTFMEPIFYLPHELSPLLSITGGRIRTVSCCGSNPGQSYSGFDTRDLECALMQDDNGVIYSIRAGFTAPYGFKRETGAHWYQIKGTRKTVEWARSTEDLPKEYTLEGGWVTHPEWGCNDPNAEEPFRSAAHGGADYYPIYHFMDAILNDHQPLMDVYLAVETAAPAILAAESARRGGVRLEVPDFRKC